MLNPDRIDMKITLANGATASLSIATNLAYHADKVYELLDKAIDSIKESSE